MPDVKTVSIGLKVYPPAIMLASAGAAPKIIPFRGTLPSGVPPDGQEVIQSALMQNPASERTLPVALAVPVTSKLYVVGTFPTPSLASVPSKEPTTPVRLNGPIVEVPAVELIFSMLVPAALVTLKVLAPLAEGVKVAVPPNNEVEEAVKAPFNVKPPDLV